MNYNKIKRILFNIIIGTVLCNCCIYAQDCDTGYTYFDELPGNVTNINNDSSCFFDDDIAVLNDLISLNNLNNYSSHFELGIQTWVTSRLVSWVATYVPSGTNGLTQKVSQLPDIIGQLSELENLYIEKHDLTELPDNFTQLSNLITLGISNNYLTSLPEEFGNLLNLETLDLGYNQLESIPGSIGNLGNIVYLFLFNNQLSSVPETICDLDLDWDGISAENYPYFAIGGNQLCECCPADGFIPECVENSANFNISMEQNYYSFLIDAPQDCSGLTCDIGDINDDETWNVLDIVNLANCVLAQNCPDIAYGCSGDLNGDSAYNVLDIVILANCVLAQNCGG